MLVRFDPTGVVRDLELTLNDLGSEMPRFSVSAEMTDIGVAADGQTTRGKGVFGQYSCG